MFFRILKISLCKTDALWWLDKVDPFAKWPYDRAAYTRRFSLPYSNTSVWSRSGLPCWCKYNRHHVPGSGLLLTASKTSRKSWKTRRLATCTKTSSLSNGASYKSEPINPWLLLSLIHFSEWVWITSSVHQPSNLHAWLLHLTQVIWHRPVQPLANVAPTPHPH